MNENPLQPLINIEIALWKEYARLMAPSKFEKIADKIIPYILIILASAWIGVIFYAIYQLI
jgi:hypothetical protein